MKTHQRQRQMAAAAAPRSRLPMLLLLLVCSWPFSEAAAAAAPTTAAATWLPLTRHVRTRAAVAAGFEAAAGHSSPASSAASGSSSGGRMKRRLAESAFVLGGSTAVGYYTAEMRLGTPPRAFHLILDSGSSLTVVPCASCDCGYHTSAPFNPSKSRTSRPVGCGECRIPRATCNATAPGRRQCAFANAYAEGSTSGGGVWRDVLQLPGPQRNRGGGAAASIPSSLPGFIFGCASYQTGQLYTQEADGVAGLGTFPTSLPNQLAAAAASAAIAAAAGRRGRAAAATTAPAAAAAGVGAGAAAAAEAAGVFSLCLGRDGGALALGRAPAPPGVSAPLQYAPLLPSTRGFYAIPLAAVQVANVTLDAAALAGHGRGAAGAAGRPGQPPAQAVLVDSGATFTYMTKPLHKAVVAAVADALRPHTAAAARARHASSGSGSGSAVYVERVSSPISDGDVCYRLSGPGARAVRSEYDLGATFPRLELVFAGGARLHMPPQRYLFVAARRRAPAAPGRGPMPPGGPDVAAAATAAASGGDEIDGGGGAVAGAGAATVVCLGMFDGDDETVIGAAAMRDALWEFDPVSAKRVGFADANCGVAAAAAAVDAAAAARAGG